MLTYALGDRLQRSLANGSERRFDGYMYLLLTLPELMFRMVAGDGKVVVASVAVAESALQFRTLETDGTDQVVPVGLPPHAISQMWEQLYGSFGKPDLSAGSFLSRYDGPLKLVREDGHEVDVRLTLRTDEEIRVAKS